MEACRWSQRAIYLGMGDMARYQAMGGPAHFAMPHELYPGGLPEYGLHEAGANGPGFSSVLSGA